MRKIDVEIRYIEQGATYPIKYLKSLLNNNQNSGLMKASVISFTLDMQINTASNTTRSRAQNVSLKRMQCYTSTLGLQKARF